MTRAALALILILAAGVALADAPARALDLTMPATQQPISPCVVETLKVDGIAVVEHRWCVWTGSTWVPLISEEGQSRVFGIKPEQRQPIPKYQRRLE